MTNSKPSASKPASLRQGKYRLHFETQAWQEWKALDGAPKKALREALIKRLDNPHVPGSALKGELAGCYKIKLLKAGYRLVYEVLDDVVVVLVWPPGRSCRDLAGLEMLMGFGLQTPCLQPIPA